MSLSSLHNAIDNWKLNTDRPFSSLETKEIEQDAKLVRPVEQRHIDVHALSKELQEKRRQGLLRIISTDRPAC